MILAGAEQIACPMQGALCDEPAGEDRGPLDAPFVGAAQQECHRIGAHATAAPPTAPAPDSTSSSAAPNRTSPARLDGLMRPGLRWAALDLG
jgi:hypothetical protein